MARQDSGVAMNSNTYTHHNSSASKPTKKKDHSGKIINMLLTLLSTQAKNTTTTHSCYDLLSLLLKQPKGFDTIAQFFKEKNLHCNLLWIFLTSEPADAILEEFMRQKKHKTEGASKQKVLLPEPPRQLVDPWTGMVAGASIGRHPFEILLGDYYIEKIRRVILYIISCLTAAVLANKNHLGDAQRHLEQAQKIWAILSYKQKKRVKTPPAHITTTEVAEQPDKNDFLGLYLHGLVTYLACSEEFKLAMSYHDLRALDMRFVIINLMMEYIYKSLAPPGTALFKTQLELLKKLLDNQSCDTNLAVSFHPGAGHMYLAIHCLNLMYYEQLHPDDTLEHQQKIQQYDADTTANMRFAFKHEQDIEGKFHTSQSLLWSNNNPGYRERREQEEKNFQRTRGSSLKTGQCYPTIV